MSPDLLRKMNAYWRAANYLSVGQIYLYDNPMLKKPLKLEHVKPRLLGHFGTTTGLNLIYVHLNRIIKQYDLNMIYITGPGHGGPGLVANTYLEGTYSELYPNISQDEQGMKKLFTQFSFPGGIPSHVAPETPGSIHEGGELGYSLSHAYGAAFDNPDLIVACVVGDGEAETGPLATSWHSNKFLNPVTDGAVLPILHLNGYKIAGPTVLGRIDHEELDQLFRGYGYKPYFVEGDDPMKVHQLLAATLDTIVAEIKDIQIAARTKGFKERPQWPMIILRTPKGWTCPKVVDGLPIEGTFRAHQVPITDFVAKPKHLKILEQWMKSYRAEELFDKNGRLIPELAELAPKGERRMGANPHANGGLLLKELKMPDFRDYAVKVPKPGVVEAETTRVQGEFIRDVLKLNSEARNFRVFSPDETASNRWTQPLRDYEPLLNRGNYSHRRSCRTRWPGDGDVERAPVRGLAGRLPTDRPARFFLMLRSVHPHHRFDVQPARQVAQGGAPYPMAAADCFTELSALIARVAAGPQWIQPPGPGFHRPRGEQEGGNHPRLSAAGRQHPAVGHRPLPAQPQLRQCHRRGQTAGAPMAGHGCSHQALHGRAWHLGMGQQRQGRRPRCGDGLLRRCAHPGDTGRCRDPATALPGTEDPCHQRGGLDDASAAERASSRVER